MIFDQLIVYLLSNSEKLLQKGIIHVKQNSFDAFIDTIVIFMLLLCTYIIWEYMSFYSKRINTRQSFKHLDNDFIYNVDECPICLNEFTTPVRLECGHAYCLNCLVTYFKTNSFKWRCICPLCKILVKKITTLNNYAKHELNEKEKKRLEKLLQQMLNKQQSEPLLFCVHLWQNKLLKFFIITITTTLLFTIYLIMSYYILDLSIHKIPPIIEIDK